MLQSDIKLLFIALMNGVVPNWTGITNFFFCTTLDTTVFLMAPTESVVLRPLFLFKLRNSMTR